MLVADRQCCSCLDMSLDQLTDARLTTSTIDRLCLLRDGCHLFSSTSMDDRIHQMLFSSAAGAAQYFLQYRLCQFRESRWRCRDPANLAVVAYLAAVAVVVASASAVALVASAAVVLA